jgi:hypothetical protein
MSTRIIYTIRPDPAADLDNAQKVLRRAGVIDDSSYWIGGETVLVQTGDIVDR